MEAVTPTAGTANIPRARRRSKRTFGTPTRIQKEQSIACEAVTVLHIPSRRRAVLRCDSGLQKAGKKMCDGAHTEIKLILLYGLHNMERLVKEKLLNHLKSLWVLYNSTRTCDSTVGQETSTFHSAPFLLGIGISRPGRRPIRAAKGPLFLHNVPCQDHPHCGTRRVGHTIATSRWSFDFISRISVCARADAGIIIATIPPSLETP